MNVGLVVPGFSADPGDWCIPALRHLARDLALADDVRVLAIRYPHRRARYAIDGAGVIALGGAISHGPGTLAVWRATLQTLLHEHRRRHFDVLHAFWATESGLLAALAGRLLRVPVLVSLAGGELVGLRDIGYGDQRLAWERLKVRASLRLASAVSAGSELLVALAERHVARPRVHRAPLGVDTQLFSLDGAASAPHAQRRLLHVATLTRVKDQVTLVRAFAALHQNRPAVRLDIVGSGPLLPELERLAANLGVAEHVCFRGSLDHDRLPAVYRAAAAFILSSRHEAQAMVALEAAACGTPIVGTRVGVLPELTRAVVPVGAHVALAEAIEAAITQAGSSLVPTSRVESEFGLRACTDRFRALYAGLRVA